MPRRFTLEDLEAIVRERAAAPPSESYTAKLLKDGAGKAAKKYGEESVEVVIASLSGSRKELTMEAADALYHLLVVLHGGGVSLADVMDELADRTRQSGLAEKAARPG
jgi:phosphoribosyl-ATP pyrophosphohydrolase